MSATGDNSSGHGGYALGHSDRELDRLSAQARLIDPITRQFFREAGIAPGMRVLDVGSGAGDVAFLLAELVGDSGDVVGVDRAPGALAVARARADADSRRNVSFLRGRSRQDARLDEALTPSLVVTSCSFNQILWRCSESLPAI